MRLVSGCLGPIPTEISWGRFCLPIFVLYLCESNPWGSPLTHSGDHSSGASHAFCSLPFSVLTPFLPSLSPLPLVFGNFTPSLSWSCDLGRVGLGSGRWTSRFFSFQVAAHRALALSEK